MWFGDAPGHDPICTAISGVGADITEGTATIALAGRQITVVAISTDTGTTGALDGDPTAENFDYGVCTIGGSPGQATRIAAATGGSHTTGVDATTIIDTLISLISAAVQSINHLVLQPTGAIAPFVTSIAPPSYDSLAGDVDHTLPFDVTWTGVVDCADEDQVFTGSLDVVADGTVVASKPVTITVPACRWHHSTEMICGLQRGGDDDKRDECQTVVDGRYATAVTIYNPSTCTVTLVKYFAPLILDGKPVGREPRAVFARPFAKLAAQAGSGNAGGLLLPGGGRRPDRWPTGARRPRHRRRPRARGHRDAHGQRGGRGGDLDQRPHDQAAARLNRAPFSALANRTGQGGERPPMYFRPV